MNIFPKFGSFGDCANPEDLISKPNNNVYPTWTWITGIKDEEGKEISVTDLIQKYNTLLNENAILREELESYDEINKEIKNLRDLASKIDVYCNLEVENNSSNLFHLEKTIIQH